jgi:hypothetical protein
MRKIKMEVVERGGRPGDAGGSTRRQAGARALPGEPLGPRRGMSASRVADLHRFLWRSDCSGLFHTPIAA